MNDKVKALWMAQYLGQSVLGCDKESDRPIKELKYIRNDKTSDCCYLLLRTVDMLTDEEAQNVCELINVSNYAFVEEPIRVPHFKKIQVLTTDKDGDGYGGSVDIYYDGDIQWDYHNIGKYGGYALRLFSAYDYLRSIGIILPFTFLNESNQPETLTPAQLIEMGWVKIKTT